MDDESEGPEPNALARETVEQYVKAKEDVLTEYMAETDKLRRAALARAKATETERK